MTDSWTDSNGDNVPSDWTPGGPLTPAGDWAPDCGCAPPDGPSIAKSVTITGSPGGVTSVQNGKALWSLVLNDGTPEADFRIDRFDNAGLLADSPMTIVRATGVVSFHDPVMLAADPAEDLEAATKHYVDATGLREAPMDQQTYGRDMGAWVPLPSSYMPEAPNTSIRFGRFNSTWQPDAIQTDAPADGGAYARQNGDWTAAVTGGPYLPLTGGTITGVLNLPPNNQVNISGPVNSTTNIVGQRAGVPRWSMALGDSSTETISNGGCNFRLDSYSVTGGYIATPLVITRAGDATFSAGVSINGMLALNSLANFYLPGGNPGDVLSTNGSGLLAWAARVTEAPNDGQFYARRNLAWEVAPGGMTDAPNDGTAYARKSQAWAHLTHTDITDWTATLAPYALTTSVPVASATLPLMNGAAAAGSSAAFARGDHVHPSDTSRFPTVGGTITGNVTIAATTLAITNPSGFAQMILGKSASGQANQIVGYTGVPSSATLRWNIQLGGPTAETGSNVGSDFGISRYSDAGALIDTPLAINRANGVVTLSSNLTLSAGGITLNNSSAYVAASYLRQNAHNFQFNYVLNGTLNQFACSIDGAYNVIVKSISVPPFTASIDTMALNGAGGSMGAWSGGSGAQWTVAVSSDRRLKSNLAPPDKDALAAVNAIPVYQCDMTQPIEGAESFHWDWAVIADEVQPVLPLGVIPPNDAFPYAGMRDYPFIPMLIKAVQQLTARVAELEAAHG